MPLSEPGSFKGVLISASGLLSWRCQDSPFPPEEDKDPEGLGDRDRMGGRTKNGPEGIRTPDLCRAKAALSQLSYRPFLWKEILFLLLNSSTVEQEGQL